MDFIVGLPFDDEQRIENQLKEVAPFVKHVSVYMLSVEKRTPLETLVKEGKIAVADVDRQIDLFEVACSTLKNLGFERYEVSNFALDGLRSNHNTGYWTREEYLGLGLNASSLTKTATEFGITEQRFKNTDNFKNYLLDARKSTLYYDFSREIEVLSSDEIFEETVMLALRLNDGIDKKFLGEKSDIMLRKFPDFVVDKGDKIALNGKGMDVMNHILVEIL